MTVQGKGPPEEPKEKAAPDKQMRTLVGVPTLQSAVPPDEPSQTLIGEGPAEPREGDANTAVDVKALSAAEADRVLSWTGFTQEEIPTVPGPEEKSSKSQPPAARKATPAPARVGADPRATHRGVAPQAPLRPQATPSVRAPVPATGVKGRATLLLDSSAPPVQSQEGGELAPIVVPHAGAMVPKAVTQPPPWGDGAVRMDSGIPRPGLLPDGRAKAGDDESIEELSGSVLLPEVFDPKSENEAEELSGSVLLSDDEGNLVPAPPARPGVGVKTAPGYAIPRPHHGPTKPSPVALSRPPPAALKALSGAAPTRAASTPIRAATPAPSSPPTRAAAPVTGSPHPPGAAVALRTAPMAPVAADALKTVPLPSVAPAAVPAGDSASAPPLPAGVPIPEPIDPFASPAGADSPPPAVAPPAFTTEPGLGNVPRAASPDVVPPAPDTMPWVAPPDEAPAPEGSASRDEPTRRLDRFLPKLGILVGARPKWFLPVVAVGGFVVGVGLIGLLVSIFKGSDSTTPTAPAASRVSSAPTASSTPHASSSMARVVTPPPPASTAPAPAPFSANACALGTPPHTVSPNVVVASGVEVATLGDALALGFATGAKDALAVRVDPASLEATRTELHASDAIRRVTPILSSKGTVDGAADTEDRRFELVGRRTVVADPPFDLGADGKSLVAVPHGASAAAVKKSAQKLWALQGDGAVEQLRAIALPGGGSEKAYAVAFRRGNAIWIGLLSRDVTDASKLTTKGPLARFAGLGDRIGSPSIAATGETVLVAWADRKSKGDSYGVRFTSFKAGDTPPEATTFTAPAGGLGSHVMAPGVAGLAGGRFLFVWTEGPEGKHQVRAQTLRADGLPLGSAMTVSADGVNAGQGQAAVLPDGRGVVAFLAASGKTGDVIAVPVTCPL